MVHMQAARAKSDQVRMAWRRYMPLPPEPTNCRHDGVTAPFPEYSL